MSTGKEIKARVAKMPEFAFRGGRSGISRGASYAFPGGEDHEVDLAIRTGRALQHTHPKKLDDSIPFSIEELRAAMSSVAYVPLTETAEESVRHILGSSWDYWHLLP